MYINHIFEIESYIKCNWMVNRNIFFGSETTFENLKRAVDFP